MKNRIISCLAVLGPAGLVFAFGELRAMKRYFLIQIKCFCRQGPYLGSLRGTRVPTRDRAKRKVHLSLPN